eukprot:2726004-Rhodomonas_salina.1
MCSRTHIKSQHECLLRQLQMALVDKIITASDFSASEDDSFLGWVGFQIVAEHKDEFRARIEGMFATVPKENTLNNAFRRAGLVPKQCWNEAWKGKAAFFYDGTKRATGTCTTHCGSAAPNGPRVATSQPLDSAGTDLSAPPNQTPQDCSVLACDAPLLVELRLARSPVFGMDSDIKHLLHPNF